MNSLDSATVRYSIGWIMSHDGFGLKAITEYREPELPQTRHIMTAHGVGYRLQL